jgi:CRISPR-associated endonuclease/helicase Cas3
MDETSFNAAFEVLTGNRPFPWQWELYTRFLAGDFPASCSLPTGLGKTSVIHLWLLALAQAPTQVPRRLVYVVNRRTVVDQSTDEARKLRERLANLPEVAARLRELCADPAGIPLAISTLRGQFADNREWSSDPARPAVIAGTVDMIGSRLLFSGYGCGFKSRPLHAGFLGQDVLLVHDEAHLEPAFQELVTAIEREQRSGRTPDFRPLRVMELTATSRADGQRSFGLEVADYANVVVQQRIFAKKGIALHECADEKKMFDKVAELALAHKDSGRAILVFVSSIEGVNQVEGQLRKAKQAVQLLTGTQRGHERDGLPDDPIFARFLPESNRSPEIALHRGTVYLICTSAGEVGVNISADHLVCDLTSFESMAQRFGRVNRFGLGDALIDVVHPKAFETEDNPRQAARERTLALLRRLPRREDGRHDASPHALNELNAADRQAAFSPRPTILPVSDNLFDAWALTSVREPLPGRPRVADYLHGMDEREPPETNVAWREEVGLFRHSGLSDKELGELLEDYPLKPHELLRDRSDRVSKHLVALAKEHGDQPVWLVDDNDALKTFTLKELVGEKERIHWQTVVLPPDVGGLTRAGMLGLGGQPDLYDVADEWGGDSGQLRQRETVTIGMAYRTPDGMRRVAVVPLRPPDDEEEEPTSEDGEPAGRKARLFFVRARAGDDDGSKTARGCVALDTHHSDAAKVAEALATRLLPEELRPVLVAAARFHDLGKRRDVWQRSIGNTDKNEPWAKSGTSGWLHGLNDYRHEFGSLLDTEAEAEFMKLSTEQRELMLHLIAAHHGRGRPHFPAGESFDLERAVQDAARVAGEVPRRFARLQRNYGRWGLAWLESLLRAADAEASASPSEVRHG